MFPFIYKVFSKSIETEAVFSMKRMNNEWNLNFFQNSNYIYYVSRLKHLINFFLTDFFGVIDDRMLIKKRLSPWVKALGDLSSNVFAYFTEMKYESGLKSSYDNVISASDDIFDQ